MKVLVLAIDGMSTWLLVNALRTRYPDLQVALEDPVSKLSLLKRRVKRVGLRTVIGQVCFMACVPMLRRLSRKRVQELIASAGLSVERPVDLAIQKFASVNSDDCCVWLSAENPDVVVVNGTRILSNAVLNSCNAVFLNIHCGITPAYRGVHGGYWAVYSGEPGNAGVTIHVVDAGIDTGSIVYQETISIDGQDSFLTYPVKQYMAGIPLMRKALSDVERGELSPKRRDDLPSAIWFHPTLCQYLAARWGRNVC